METHTFTDVPGQSLVYNPDDVGDKTLNWSVDRETGIHSLSLNITFKAGEKPRWTEKAS